MYSRGTSKDKKPDEKQGHPPSIYCGISFRPVTKFLVEYLLILFVIRDFPSNR